MGILVKHTQNTEREKALAWWKGLKTSQKKEAVSIWQEQLPNSDTVKYWDYWLIALSSSKVELMFHYFKEV